MAYFSVVFQCCSGALHKCQKHSRNPMACNDPWVQWCRQSGIFGVSGERCPQRSWEAENLWKSGAKPWNADDKAAGKKASFNFAVLDNIIQHFYFTRNQKHFTKRSPMAQKLSLDLLRFYAHGQLRGSEPPASCTNRRTFIFFKQNVSGSEGISINGHTIP